MGQSRPACPVWAPGGPGRHQGCSPRPLPVKRRRPGILPLGRPCPGGMRELRRHTCTIPHWPLQVSPAVVYAKHIIRPSGVLELHEDLPLPLLWRRWPPRPLRPFCGACPRPDGGVRDRCEAVAGTAWALPAMAVGDPGCRCRPRPGARPPGRCGRYSRAGRAPFLPGSRSAAPGPTPGGLLRSGGGPGPLARAPGRPGGNRRSPRPAQGGLCATIAWKGA